MNCIRRADVRVLRFRRSLRATRRPSLRRTAAQSLSPSLSSTTMRKTSYVVAFFAVVITLTFVSALDTVTVV